MTRPRTALLAACLAFSCAGATATAEYTGKHFSFSYPSEWTRMGAYENGDVIVAPPDGFEGGGLRNGLVFGFAEFTGVPEKQQRRIVLSRHMANNPTAVLRPETSVTTQAGQAMVVNMSNHLPDGADEKIRIALFQKSAGIFYVVLVTPAPKDGAAYPALYKILESARYLEPAH